jgi:hypothetical protein
VVVAASLAEVVETVEVEVVGTVDVLSKTRVAGSAAAVDDATLEVVARRVADRVVDLLVEVLLVELLLVVDLLLVETGRGLLQPLS